MLKYSLNILNYQMQIFIQTENQIETQNFGRPPPKRESLKIFEKNLKIFKKNLKYM